MKRTGGIQASDNERPTSHRKLTFGVGMAFTFVLLTFAAAANAQDIDHSAGFASHTDLTANPSAVFSSTAAQLTSAPFEAGSIFSNENVCIKSFTTEFRFQITPLTTPPADGFTFAMQSNSPTALGLLGGQLGYLFIPNGAAVRFDYGFNNFGEGTNATGLFLNATLPGIAVDLTGSGINLQDNHEKRAALSYDGSTLIETITDLSTNVSFSHTYNGLDIRSLVGGSTAHVGFTGGTGLFAAVQDVLSWTFNNPPPTIKGVSVNKPVLWPPDQKLKTVTVNYTSTDPCSAPVCTLSVSSNEPGDDTEWVIIDAHHVQLRADRNGYGTGRIYTIAITCTDAAGNTATSTVTVTVPHDQGPD